MAEKIVTDSNALDYRIYVHNNFAKHDLDEWVFENLDIKTGFNVLDIGCGSGKHLFSISKLVGNEGIVSGIDLSEESLEKCREKIQENSADNVKVYRGDLTEIKEKLPGTKYNRALSSFAIYYTTNLEKTFNDIHELMENDSLLFLCGPTLRNNLEYIDLVKRAGGSLSKDFDKWSNFLEDDAKNFLETLFDEVEVVYFNNPIEFPDGDTLFNYWKATPLYSEALEEKMKELISEEFKYGKKFVTTKVVVGLRCLKK